MMSSRERMLAMAAGGFGVLLVLWFFGSQVWGEFSTRYEQLDELQAELRAKQQTINRGQRAASQLKEWEERSLPADIERARGLYRNWLLTLVDAADWDRADVSPSHGTNREGAYHKLPFSVSGRGSWEELTQFLYGFYSAGHLQQIRSLTLTPIAESEQLEIALAIEALVLPGTERVDTLSNLPGELLALATMDDYQKTLESRSLFAVYKPPRKVEAPRPRAEPAQPRPPQFDVARHAFVTAILDVGGRPQVWITVRPTGELLKLREGDSLAVGTVKGLIRRIQSRQVTIEAGGKTLAVELGQPLVGEASSGREG